MSPITGEWIISRAQPGQKPVIEAITVNDDGSKTVRELGNKHERDVLVPQIYYKELLAHDELPDTINGIEVNAHLLRTHEMMLNSSPRDIVKRNPGVWMMMESMPERVDLSDPTEVFRFTPDGRMEFVDMATNSVVEGRSRRFTETLRNRGFAFPATDLSANVTSRKPYDEGYLMIDAEGKVFHVKQQAGRPYVAAVQMPEGKKASKVFILEEANRDILGLVIDTENNPYFLEREGYTLMPIPIGKVDPRKENLLMLANLFNFTFRVSGNGSSTWYAVERTPNGYELLSALPNEAPRTLSAIVADYVFPFTISFISNMDSVAYPRIAFRSWHCLYLNVILALILIVPPRSRNTNAPRRRPCWAGAVITLFCGLFSFIPSLLFRK